MWAQALAQDFGQHRGAFYGFAADELRRRTASDRRPTGSPSTDQQDGSDLAELIATTTGRSSVQEALEQRRSLYLDLASSPRKIAIDKLVAPRLTRHPWASMLAQLEQKPSDEPLAKATPADFYFLRVLDFSTLLDLAAFADSWGTQALDVLDDGQIQDRDLRVRYQTELALDPGELSRTFGPSLMDELALVGSDPYLVEGSDLTLIFRVKNKLLLDAALSKSLTACAVAHPGGETQKLSHEGVEITVTRSADGRIQRQRASVDGLELVSNSPGAIRRVISAIHGKVPCLANEPDFSYLLARDAQQSAPILAFAGDRFVESVIGRQQKVKEAERALSLAELSRPGYAALLYGFLSGHSRAGVRDLVHEAPTRVDSRPGSRDPQLVVDLKGKKQGAIATVLTWMLTKGLSASTTRAYDAANAIFVGAPEAAADPARAELLMRNYFGSAVKTPEGNAYTFGPDGVRDPLRGSASSPAWPMIPVPGSPVARAVDRLESFRSEVAFDPEPSTQSGTELNSLRVHLTLSLR